jgi:hypothetical protein
MDSSFLRIIAVSVASLLLAGCGGGGSAATPAATTAPVNLSGGTVVQVTLAATGGTTPTGAVGGYSGILSYGQESSSSTVATITTTGSPTTSFPSTPPASVLMNFVVSVNQAVVLSGPAYISQVTLPPFVSTSGTSFYETAYDLTANTTLGTSSSPAINGQTLTFNNSFSTSTLNAGDNYDFVISGT